MSDHHRDRATIRGRRRVYQIGVAVGFMLASSCYPQPITPPATEPCAAMCATGRRLACEWAATTPSGATCETVCETVEATGYDTLRPSCVAEAASCEDAERRSREGCQ